MRAKKVNEYLNEDLDYSNINVVINNIKDIFEDMFFNSDINVIDKKDNHIFIYINIRGDYEDIIKDLIYEDVKDLFKHYGFKMVNVNIKNETHQTFIDIEYIESDNKQNIENFKEEVKDYSTMNQSTLNYELNKALDNGDRETALEISKYLKENFNKKINESINNIFKPKSEDEVKKAFEDIHPEFVNLAKIFNNGDFKVDMIGTDQRPESYFIFSINDDQKEYIFLLTQLSYIKDEAPIISYLNKKLASHGFGGAFVNNTRVRTEKQVNDFINKITNFYQ